MSTHEDAWDYDTWVASRIPEHVDAIMDRIHNSPEAVAWRAVRAARIQAAEARARAQVTINQDTGTMPAGLCWVCASEMVEPATRTTPTFRACTCCRVYDLKQGRRLGLKMVLPLMEYPTQPLLPGASFPSDRATLVALGKAWSQVSVLDAWRASIVRAVLARQAWPEGTPIALHQFQSFMPKAPMRSRMAWWAHVDRHQPELAAVLDALPGAEQLHRPASRSETKKRRRGGSDEG